MLLDYQEAFTLKKYKMPLKNLLVCHNLRFNYAFVESQGINKTKQKKKMNSLKGQINRTCIYRRQGVPDCVEEVSAEQPSRGDEESDGIRLTSHGSAAVSSLCCACHVARGLCYIVDSRRQHGLECQF